MDDDFSKKTKIELNKICKERKIKGASKKNKNQLIQLIKGFDNTPTNQIEEDTYTEELLKSQYISHKTYVQGRIETTKKIGIKVRLPSIPEDISENIVKYIIRNKMNDPTSNWNCKKGDLLSQKEGRQECKCFISNGPSSFTPSSDWDVIYFLDARKWMNDLFVLYKIPLKRTSTEWKNIKISKTQTFEDQTKQGRRPRIGWECLQPQLNSYCTKIYEGQFEDIFIPIPQVITE